LSFVTVEGETWTADARPLLDLWNASDPDAQLGLWMEPPYQANNMPSIAAAFLSLNHDNYTSGEITFNIQTCTIYTSWKPVETYIVPESDSYIHTSTSQVRTETAPNLMATDGVYIELDVDWASLALPIDNTVLPVFNAYFADLDFGFSIAMVVTNAMSRIHMDDQLKFAYKDDFVNTMNNTEFKFTTFRYGYSYSIQGITRHLALGVLILHIFIALLHTIIAVSYGWATPELKSLFDTFTLALHTPPDKIASLAGNAKSKQGRCNVKVRELSNNQLGFVVSEPPRQEAQQ